MKRFIILTFLFISRMSYSDCLSMHIVQIGQSISVTDSQVDKNNQKESSYSIQTFPWPEPKADQQLIIDKKQVLRARLEINISTLIEVFERPKDVDYYDSLVIVHRKDFSPQYFNIGRMIKGGQILRLVNTALFYTEEHAGVLVFVFEGGGSGAVQGFAILRFSQTNIELHTLPIVYHGKVVVDRKNIEKVELWSKHPYFIGQSEVDDKLYIIRDCYWRKKGFDCRSKPRIVGPFSPISISDPGVEIR